MKEFISQISFVHHCIIVHESLCSKFKLPYVCESPNSSGEKGVEGVRGSVGLCGVV